MERQSRLRYRVKKPRARDTCNSPTKRVSASTLQKLLDSSDDESTVISPTKGYWDSPSKVPASPLKLKKVEASVCIPSSVWISPKKSPQHNTQYPSPSKARVSLFSAKCSSPSKAGNGVAEPNNGGTEIEKSPSTRIAALSLESPLPLRRTVLHSSKRKATDNNIPSSPCKRLTPTKSRLTTKFRSPRGHSKEGISSPRRIEAGKATEDEVVSPKKASTSKMSLFNPRVDDYAAARQALHTVLTPSIVGREKEIEALEKFLSNHIDGKKPGSLYVSGPPGTGKTATLTKLMEKREEEGAVKSVFVNCMTVKNSFSIFQKIAASLDSKYVKKNEKETIKFLRAKFTSKGPMILLILDEIDQLDTRNQEVLYTVWEWPSLKNSRLVLVGVANALDLTDRMLPRLQARPNCQPQLLNFRPYSKKELATILQDRLQDLDGSVVKPRAMEFLAGKVAAVSGDARKVLDVCRRAVELAEGEAKKQQVLKVTCMNQSDNGSKKLQNPSALVDVSQIAQILNEIYVKKVHEEADGIPIQQKVAMATLLLVMKKGKTKEVTINKLFEVYRRICRRRNLPETQQSEFHSVCSALEDRGFVICKKHKDARQSKLRLKLDEGEVEAAFQDKNMLASILDEEQCLSAQYVFK